MSARGAHFKSGFYNNYTVEICSLSRLVLTKKGEKGIRGCYRMVFYSYNYFQLLNYFV